MNDLFPPLAGVRGWNFERHLPFPPPDPFCFVVLLPAKAYPERGRKSVSTTKIFPKDYNNIFEVELTTLLFLTDIRNVLNNYNSLSNLSRPQPNTKVNNAINNKPHDIKLCKPISKGLNAGILNSFPVLVIFAIKMTGIK